MKDGHETSDISISEAGVTEDKEINNKPPLTKGPKENFYDKIPLSKKQLDIIIVILVAALIIFFILGALVGNGII